MQVDWAGDTIPLQDPVTGEQSAAYLFVAVLPCSYYTYAEACDDMKTENWLNCHVHAFDFFGGVARLLIPDNCKTATLASPPSRNFSTISAAQISTPRAIPEINTLNPSAIAWRISFSSSEITTLSGTFSFSGLCPVKQHRCFLFSASVSMTTPPPPEYLGYLQFNIMLISIQVNRIRITKLNGKIISKRWWHNGHKSEAPKATG